MKKIKKKSIKEMNIKLQQDKLERLKEILEEYKQVLIDYSFKDMSRLAIAFDNLWHKEIDLCYDTVRKSGLPQEKKNMLMQIILPLAPTQEEREEKEKSGLSDEEWRLKKDIEFVEKEISVAQETLNNIDYESKKKIIEDVIVKKIFWYNTMRAWSIIDKEINPVKKVKK